MIREIGSEFNIDVNALKYSNHDLDGYLKGYHVFYLDSGRSAIKNVLSMGDRGQILLPDYLCASVVNCFKEDNELIFYRINKDFTINMEDLRKKLFGKTKILYIMNYFGSMNSVETFRELAGLKKQYGFTIIEDTSHSMFSNPNAIGDYCVCSLRKWFPIPDGGILYSSVEMRDITLPSQEDSVFSVAKACGMVLKTLYLQNRFDYNEIYRRIFSDSEEELDNQDQSHPMSKLSKYLLQFQDIKEMIEKRKANYRRLAEGLSAVGIEAIMKIGDSDCPFCYPVFITQRDRMRSLLQQNKVYCAVHWPAEDIALSNSENASDMGGKILSLPLDQRYTLEDMDRITEIIKKEIGYCKC